MIAKFLDPSAVCLNLEVEDGQEVIHCLADKLHTAGYVKDSFAQAALDREAVLPTGLPLLGNINAAIPHTDIEHVFKPGLAMATLASPVTFQNMVMPEEAVPVRLVFLLALDQPKAQIEMLQEIAAVLQNESVVKNLISATCVQDVMQALAV
ncbi:MAG: PTS sugar transporter subunit IIA [Anaerolineaceae bacterium]|nr:PTS sugar transporter subunit IIA [Anaerolineaceae bacterium]